MTSSPRPQLLAFSVALLARLPRSAIGAFILTLAAQAQQFPGAVLYRFEGTQPGERLGWSLAGPGDLNGDGKGDILAGGPGDFISGSFPGIVRAYSGLDGTALYTVSGQTAADGFGMALAALPDIDGDGRKDFAVGAPYADTAGFDSGSVYVYSGATGTLLNTLDGDAPGDAFGWSIDCAPDFTGDGLPDLLVGAPLADVGAADGGIVKIYTLQTATLASTLSDGTPNAEFGFCVRAMGKKPGELGDRIAVSAPYKNVGPTLRGMVTVYVNGGTSTNTYCCYSETADFGRFILGTRQPAGVAGFFLVMSNNDGSARWEIEYDSGGGASGSIGSGGGTYMSKVGHVYQAVDEDFVLGTSIYNGASGGLTSQFALPSATSPIISVAGFEMLNQDTWGDLAMGDPGIAVAGTDAGRVTVFLIGQVPPTTYCTAKTNSLACIPSMSYSGAPTVSVGDNFWVRATNVLSNRPGLLVWSLTQNQIPFGGGTLCLGPLLHRTAVQNSGGSQGVTDCTGTYEFHFSQAYLTAFGLTPGLTLYAQYYSRDDGFPAPANIGLTNALRFTVLP